MQQKHFAPAPHLGLLESYMIDLRCPGFVVRQT